MNYNRGSLYLDLYQLPLVYNLQKQYKLLVSFYEKLPISLNKLITITPEEKRKHRERFYLDHGQQELKERYMLDNELKKYIEEGNHYPYLSLEDEYIKKQDSSNKRVRN